MNKQMMRVAVLLAACCLTSCAPTWRCWEGSTAMVSDALFFGSATPTVVVSEEAWGEFLSAVVTPAFPQGLTSVASRGQWKAGDGTLVREPGHILYLVHPATPDAERAINEITVRYRSLFQQESVMRVKTEVCVSF